MGLRGLAMGFFTGIANYCGSLFTIRGRPVPNLLWYESVFRLVLLVTAVGALITATSWGHPPCQPTKTEACNQQVVNGYGFLFGVLLLIGTAAFSIGGFLGFIFGVPRTGTTDAAVQSNTNLEQVSDWLTKIVVGVSLVNAYRINAQLTLFRENLDNVFPGINGAGIAGCLVAGSAAASGFLLTYLRAKTDLVEAFSDTFSALAGAAKAKLAQVAAEVLSRPGMQVAQADRDAATSLLKASNPTDTDADSQRLVGYAQAVLKNFSSASAAFEASAKADPSGGPSVPLRAQALTLANKITEANALLPNSVPVGALTRDAIEDALASMFAGLYATPDGYKRTIYIGERLKGDSEAQRSGRLWLYLAAGYGQKQKAIQGDPGLSAEAKPQALVDNRSMALDAVRQALAADRISNLPILRQLWTPGLPGKDAQEDDLETFWDDPDFKALLSEPTAKVPPIAPTGTHPVPAPQPAPSAEGKPAPSGAPSTGGAATTGEPKAPEMTGDATIQGAPAVETSPPNPSSPDTRVADGRQPAEGAVQEEDEG